MNEGFNNRTLKEFTEMALNKPLDGVTLVVNSIGCAPEIYPGMGKYFISYTDVYGVGGSINLHELIDTFETRIFHMGYSLVIWQTSKGWVAEIICKGRYIRHEVYGSLQERRRGDNHSWYYPDKLSAYVNSMLYIKEIEENKDMLKPYSCPSLEAE
jgi:hypothetical protein